MLFSNCPFESRASHQLTHHCLPGCVSCVCSLVYGSLRSGRQLHQKLLEKVIRLPMSFFDTQPSGRLLNRFSRDTEALDTNLGQVGPGLGFPGISVGLREGSYGWQGSLFQLALKR